MHKRTSSKNTQTRDKLLIETNFFPFVDFSVSHEVYYKVQGVSHKLSPPTSFTSLKTAKVTNTN